MYSGGCRWGSDVKIEKIYKVYKIYKKCHVYSIIYTYFIYIYFIHLSAAIFRITSYFNYNNRLSTVSVATSLCLI